MLGFGPRRGRRRTAFQIKADETLRRIFPALRTVAKATLILAISAAVAWGLNQTQSAAELQPAYQQAAQFELVGAPRLLQGMILNDLQPLTRVPWSDPEICEQVHRRLAQNGWVRLVKRVAKGRPGQIIVDCEYRTPIALAQVREYFYLVDEYGARLPGTYEYDQDWLMIRGMEHEAPQPGQQWPGADAAAAVHLANLIRACPFGRQVSALVMNNYGGRVNPHDSHIVLETDGGRSRILWGSAPGDELEENTVTQKLHILSENHRRCGRIDAQHPKIDISVFPDRYLIPS